MRSRRIVNEKPLPALDAKEGRRRKMRK